MSLYLRSVQISNFRTFGTFVADVPAVPGALILSGPNGLGKSSFFDALEWSLTGRVLRFERFLKKGDTESQYLTREGTEAFSHRVSLFFNEGEPIQRSGHRHDGPVGTPIEDVSRLLVRPEWGEEVTSLSTYLGLTHFLGQASHQRFMYRDAADQWKALRVPAGVERLEHIRLRLRGKAAQMAFNRREELGALQLTQHRDRLAAWDGLVQRLRRLEATAAASGVLSREDILHRAHAVRDAVVNTLGKPLSSELSGDVGEALIQLRDEVAAARRGLEARKGVLAGLEKVPEWHSERMSSLASIAGEIMRAGAEKESSSSVSSELLAAMQAHQRSIEQQRSRHQRAKERVALLLAAQQDVTEGSEAALRAARADEGIKALDNSLSKTRQELEVAEAAAEKLRSTRLAVENAERQSALASSLASELAGLSQARASRDAAAHRLGAAVNERRSADDVAALERRLIEAKTRLEKDEGILAALQARSGAIASAVAAIAAHLNEHDRSCPVCKTEFPEGMLLRLIDRSRTEDESHLRTAQIAVDRAREDIRALEAAIGAAHSAEETLRAANDEAERTASTFVKLQAELAAKLGANEDDDLALLVRGRVSATASDLQERVRSLVAIEADAQGVESRLSQLNAAIGRLTSQLEAAKEERARADNDRAMAERRLASRIGDQGWRTEDLPSVLAAAEVERDHAEKLLADAEAELEQRKAALAAQQQALQRLDIESERLETNRRHLQSEQDSFAAQWKAADLAMPPSTAGLLQANNAVERRLSDLRTVETNLKELVSALAAASEREELDAARRAVLAETKGESLDGHRISLERAVREAEKDLAVIRRAHRAVERLADRLQNEADEFSNTILRPLNRLIGAFNDALLTTPGTAVAFSADYFKDRTGFTMQVRRKVAGRTVNRNLNPQLLLSEGQLAANGFSILCSANVSYPWSRWQALLLDDPLQHNDVIHTAAFADVMRNLVSLERYQVIMSSHDTAETDFLERKFTAAALPCVVVQLLGDSPDGVRYETRANTFARSALDGPSEKTAS